MPSAGAGPEPAQRLRAGLAPVVLPVEQHARRRAAARGRPRHVCASPRCSSAQVRRMLKDPKARALVETFGGQWLQFPRPRVDQRPTAIAFPTSTTTCASRCAARPSCSSRTSCARTAASSTSSTASTRSSTSAWRDTTASRGSRARSSGASISADTPRGGVLTQASVLTVSSYATRTSPVLRGKWILENVLNAPPPAPPAERAPSRRSQGGRRRARCASSWKSIAPTRPAPSCHSQHGPARLRSGELRRHRRLARPGRQVPDRRLRRRCPTGESFAGPDELKAILRADREPSPSAVTDKMLTYALGRGLERYDKRTVKAIASRLAASRLPLLHPGARDREEPALPEAAGERNAVMNHHPQAPAATHVSERIGRGRGAPAARRDDAGLRRPARLGGKAPAAAGVHLRPATA